MVATYYVKLCVVVLLKRSFDFKTMLNKHHLLKKNFFLKTLLLKMEKQKILAFLSQMHFWLKIYFFILHFPSLKTHYIHFFFSFSLSKLVLWFSLAFIFFNSSIYFNVFISISLSLSTPLITTSHLNSPFNFFSFSNFRLSYFWLLVFVLDFV